MMFTILVCAAALSSAALAGSIVSTNAASIVCGTDLSINITISLSDTTYFNKTVRALSPCSGTYGPIGNTAEVVTIEYCQGWTSFVIDTEYKFLFQADANYWSDSDLLIAVTCVADTTDQVFNQTLGVTPDTTDASITDVIVPVITLSTLDGDDGTTPLSFASVGDNVQVAVNLDVDYNDFGFIVNRVTAISGATSLVVVDNACVTSVGEILGFRTLFVPTTQINIDFKAFITTGSDPVSLTGNTVVINVEVGVCAPGSSACQQPNCGTTRKRRDVTDIELNEVEMSKSLVIFPTKQSETEFLTKVADQLDLDGSTDELDQNQVCVDRTISFTVIAILSGLVVFSCLVVTFILIRSRQFRGKGVFVDEREFSNKSYHS